MIPARWALTAPPDPARTRLLAETLRVPEALAALLIQRGMGAPDIARAYLRPELDRLADPGAWAGMAAAVDAIVRAVHAGTPILVHGDYDVDGQCAAALLTRTLRAVGASAHAFVPHRLRDGYDFGPAGLKEAQRVGAGLIITCDCGITAVESVRAARVPPGTWRGAGGSAPAFGPHGLRDGYDFGPAGLKEARRGGAGLIITCDCGITAVESVRAARAAGIDVVVTDHHLPGAELPP